MAKTKRKRKKKYNSITATSVSMGRIVWVNNYEVAAGIKRRILKIEKTKGRGMPNDGAKFSLSSYVIRHAGVILTALGIDY